MTNPAVTIPRVYLIRHGETDWTLTGQHTGTTDLHLTPHGVDEAISLKLRLKAIPFDRIFTSPLTRAKQTCDFAGFGDRAEVDPDLAERDYGDYEGKRSVDIRKERPGWNVYRDGCPGGENADDISERADRMIKRLRSLGGNVALFTHGQFGSAIASRWIGLMVANAQHFPLRTVSVSILSYEQGHPEMPVLSLWNSTADELSYP